MGSLDEVFKDYDIRGTVPDQLDAPLARSELRRPLELVKVAG